MVRHLTQCHSCRRPTEVMVERYGGGDPIAAVAFISPPDRRIPKGLPPTTRSSTDPAFLWQTACYKLTN